jgi:hypothetical protein
MHSQKKTLDAALGMRLCEVRELRHLLAHGYAMPGLVLFEQGAAVEYDVTHSKENKFPRLKFSRPDKLNCEDAKKALEAVLYGAHAVASAFGNVLSCVSYELDAGGTPLILGGGAITGPLERIFDRIHAF